MAEALYIMAATKLHMYVQCAPGPTGSPGDKYLSYFTPLDGTITFQSNTTANNIVSPGTYLTYIVSEYSCQIVDGDTSRTFRVGTIDRTTYILTHINTTTFSYYV